MANGVLSGIGQGLRTIGGALSPQAFAQEGAQRENIRGIEANKSSQTRDFLINAIMQGAISPDNPAAQKILSEGGMQGLGKGVQAQKFDQETQLLEQEKARKLRHKTYFDQQFGDPNASFNDPSPSGNTTTVTHAFESNLENPELWRKLAGDLLRDQEPDRDMAMKALAEAQRLDVDQRASLEKGPGGSLQSVTRTETGFEATPVVTAGGESEKEQRIARLEETGLTRNQSISIADGRHKIANDDFGRPTVIDVATGKEVYKATPGQAKEISQQRENIDVAAATGVSGAVGRALNTLAGLFGQGLVDRDAAKATNALKAIKFETLGVLEAKIPGRPSNYQLEIIEPLTLDPSSIFSGDAQSLEKLRDVRDILERESNRMQVEILDNPRGHDPKDLRLTKMNKGQMDSLIRDYKWAIDNMENFEGRTKRPSAKEIYEAN